MTSAYSKTLMGCVLLFLLGAGMKPQTSTPAASDQSAQTAPATAAAQAPAQAPEKDKQQKPTPVYESATVLKSITRLVVVDVVATDRDGAVTDLKQDDFTILEDGQEQKIRVFNFQQPHPNPSGSAVLTASKPPENVYSNAAHFSANSALNVLLLDALNTNLPHQAYVLDQMIRYLQKMPQGQPIAVYMLSTKLTLLQDFTDDPEALKKVAKEIKSSVSPLLDNASDRKSTRLLPAGLADSGIMPAQMLSAMQTFEQERVAFQTDMRMTYTLNALNSIARCLSGYPGRKNLIWISEAFPLTIDPNLDLTGDTFAGTRNYGTQIAEATDLLTNPHIMLYPVVSRELV